MTHRLIQPDGQPAGTPHMFHTEGMQNILHSAAPQTTEHIWAADVTRKETRGCCMVLRACSGACVYEWLFGFIFRAYDTFVFHTEAVRTCVYVYNQMGHSRVSRFVGGRREDQTQSFTGVNTISYWELDSDWGVEARHVCKQRSCFRSVEDADVLTTTDTLPESIKKETKNWRWSNINAYNI